MVSDSTRACPCRYLLDTPACVQDLQELSRHSLLRRAARMSVEACTLGREKAELLSLHRDRRSGLTMLAASVFHKSKGTVSIVLLKASLQLGVHSLTVLIDTWHSSMS